MTSVGRLTDEGTQIMKFVTHPLSDDTRVTELVEGKIILTRGDIIAPIVALVLSPDEQAELYRVLAGGAR